MENVIKAKYPLHFFVWQNDANALENLLKEEKYDVESLDSRGRTPLFLAVKLSHLDCVKVLLASKANANFECDGWSVVQEAVCSGDANVLIAILEVRDLQRHHKRVSHVPELLKNLLDAPDFYVEMKWEFTSWVPLMSRLCPSDTYKVYKRGSNVRIDTTLLGFDNNTWQRGNRSYIFKGQADSAILIEIDHEVGEVSIEHMRNIEHESVLGITPSDEAINLRLQSPVISNHIDMDKISFERNKSGFWGWRSEKCENVNGYDCKVYGASNVEFITRTRTEHLNEEQARLKNSRTPLQHILGMGEEEYENAASNTNALKESVPMISSNDYNVASSVETGPEDMPTLEEYFSGTDLNGKDIGKPKRITTKTQRFKANVWLSEEFPIKLQEQVLPILDLMSTLASPHVSKLKDFITMQLPSGFPVRIEIPLFHVLSAVVTFGNVFAMETSVTNVSYITESEDRITCVIDDLCFEVPPSYSRKGSEFRRQVTFEDEDELIQFAIQQSLIESGSENDQVDIWEALRAQRPITPSYYDDEQLQRALQESLLTSFQASSSSSNSGQNNSEDADRLPDYFPNLELAIKLSQDEEKQREENARREQEMLEQVLRLSLEEK